MTAIVHSLESILREEGGAEPPSSTMQDQAWQTDRRSRFKLAYQGQVIARITLAA